MDPIQTAALAIVPTVFVLYRQMKTRIATGYGLRYTAIAMIAIGLLSGGLVDPHNLALSVTLLVVEAALAVAFGIVRAATVRVWRDETGVPWSRATGWTLVGWLASLATRFALLGTGPLLGLDLAFTPTALLVFVGLTIGAQSLFVARRAHALPLAPSPATPVGA
ncbi:hypothetical protein AB0M44_24840 [Streptosporangium subroseum]|uniref:hypothetical protein n=1 Tax=Streptosporangium subroseum TaxID=106412 RepID=UPI00342F4D22